MPGRPGLRKLTREIKRRSKEAGLDGEEWLYAEIAEGKAVGAIAKDLGVGRRTLYTWRDQHGHAEERRRMWEEAMTYSAEAAVEEAQEDFDSLDHTDGDLTGPQVQLVSQRAKLKQWLAAKRDPERFGDRTRVDVTHSIGDLHLEALLEAKRQSRALSAPGPEVIEAEVLD